MPSDTKENYLKAIYALEEAGEKISLSALSRRINVSIPTVNNMVKKLEREGWVQYQKYKPILFTEVGRKEAAGIVRKHRLAEIFLVQEMGIGWEKVHDIAEYLEHIDSDIFFDRIDEILDFPKTDPHGTPIPDKNGQVILNNFRNLSEVKVGDTVILRALNHENKDFLIFLNKKQISLGTHIKVEAKESFDGSVEISYNNFKNVTLTKEVCEKLLVEEIKK